MESLKFDEGFREYDINGDKSRIVRFRVDPNLKERIEKAMADIEQLRAKYERRRSVQGRRGIP